MQKNEEETVQRRMPNQSILSEYVYKVEEKTGKDTDYYATHMKCITKVTSHKHVHISEVDTENISHAVQYVGMPMVT